MSETEDKSTDKHVMADWPLKRYDFPMPFSYQLSPASGAGVVICLHGFQDHAHSMLRRLGWWKETLPFQVLAVNGPFPVPVWREHGFVEAYSWYFRDTSGALDFMSPEITAERLGWLINDLGLSKTPKILFGFSMGGYLSPYLATAVPEVRAIIGYSCGYVKEIYAKCQPLHVYGIHGDQDERIPFSSSQSEFTQVLQLGHRGEFHLIPQLKHKVDHKVEPLIRRLVLEGFANKVRTNP